MSKLAHSHQPTMNAIEFDRAIEDGNEDLLAGFYWVRLDGGLLVAEWANKLSGKWRWHLTSGEQVDRVQEIIEDIEPPSMAIAAE